MDRTDFGWNWPSLLALEPFSPHSKNGLPIPFMPSLDLVWPTLDGAASMDLEQLCNEIRPPELVRDSKVNTSCGWGSFRLSEFRGNSPLLKLITGEQEKLESTFQVQSKLLFPNQKPERYVLQWGQFVTQLKDGEHKWLGWICDTSAIQKLEEQRGIISPDGSKVMLLDAGNAECYASPSGMQRLLSLGRHKVHDVGFECHYGGTCRAMFMYGKDLMSTIFSDVGSIIPGQGVSMANYLRPRYVQAAWQALERMQHEAREPALIKTRVHERMNWNRDVCMALLEGFASARASGQYSSRKLPRDVAKMVWKSPTNHCGKAVAALTVQMHLAQNESEKIRYQHDLRMSL